MPTDHPSNPQIDLDFILRIGAMEGTVRTMERDIESLKTDVSQIKEQQAVNTTTINQINDKMDKFLEAQESSSDHHRAHESTTERIARTQSTNPWKRPIGEIVADCAMTALKWALTAAFVALLIYAFGKIGASPVTP